MHGEQQLSQVITEAGTTRVFASFIDWPGWSRSGMSEELAIEALIDYAERYAPVAAHAGLSAPLRPQTLVVDRQTGNAATNFGATNVIHDLERMAISKDACLRHIGLLRASWEIFDETVATESADLRKGPRGGGRSRDQIVGHVADAERGFARRIGVLTPTFESNDRGAALAHRDEVFVWLEALAATGAFETTRWPVRYAIRRMAWHYVNMCGRCGTGV